MFEILQAVKYSELNPTQEKILVSLGKVYFFFTFKNCLLNWLNKEACHPSVILELSEKKNVALIN